MFFPVSRMINALLSRFEMARSGAAPSPTTSTRVRTVSISVSLELSGTSSRRPRNHIPSIPTISSGANSSGPKKQISPRSTSIEASIIIFHRSPFQYSHSRSRDKSRDPVSGHPRNTRSTAASPTFSNRGSLRYKNRSTRSAPPKTSKG